ncbi:MAG: hypothetical protein K6B67_08185 [Lachnospiraceae bacterium]|nr:hypothetical protein [Lachnospiraceae bacterium]
MEEIVKSFLGVFFLLFLTFLVYGFSSASISARNADAFMALVAEDLRDSNCSANMIAAAKEDAKNLGYVLEVDVHSSKTTKKYGNATLKYEYKIPVIGLEEDKYISTRI